MELTPELLLEAKFAPAKRGYDMAEVDDFLERCAEGLDVLLARLKSEYERAERAEAALMDAPARDESAVAAEEPAPVREPAPAPDRSPADADEPLRILVMAERTAEATINEARQEAEKIRAEAESVASRHRSEAERLLSNARNDAEAEARRAAEDAKRAIEQELSGLRRTRDGLDDDVKSLSRWLDEQRARMRTAVREMNRLIDDPTALRELPVPDLSQPAASSEEAEDAGDLWEPAAGDDVDESGGEPTRAVPPIDLGPDPRPQDPAAGPGEVSF